MDKFICVHGHFYQPPRENPWLEAIELQDSAYPYHDWNERITAECYGPNGTSRILNERHRIIQIVNNYARISFNFGPTLLSWMEENAPEVYRTVLEADHLSRERFSGHGSALAQVYNHLIMPLANDRDKYTQVIWGLRDFEMRFGRKAEGMWLPEAAVDLRTLEVLVECGVKFTILAPHQAQSVRLIGQEEWRDVSGGTIDPKTAYLARLPSGKTITLFFYDGPISRAVAFEKLLNKGEFLVNRLRGAFADDRSRPQLVHIATDGETYGHHHRHGDMALAYALSEIERKGEVQLTNYGAFVEKFPPQMEVTIYENSSWSCAHGVERWRSNCGCHLGHRRGWNQAWRAPLREAFDWLRDECSMRFEQKAKAFLKDPWAARNDYVDLASDRSIDAIQVFFQKNEARTLTESEQTEAIRLMELERQLMLMYTSCGWFFDELSGIETVQVIQYAGRAVQLAEQLFGESFEERFLEKLENAKSNIHDHKDGRVIYQKFIKPSAMDLKKVAAHYAISSLFEDGAKGGKTYCYDVAYDDYKSFLSGKARLVSGVVRITSEVTLESGKYAFGVIHLGDHNISGGIRVFGGDANYQKTLDELIEAFRKADFPEAVRSLDRIFGGSIYSLKTLFRDEQRSILNSILDATLSDAEGVLRQIYENNAPLMRFLADLMVPFPKALQAAAEFSLNANLRAAFEGEETDLDRITSLLSEAKDLRIPFDAEGLSFSYEKNLSHLMDQLWADPEDYDALAALESSVGFTVKLPFEVNLWNIQNNYYQLLKSVYPTIKEKAEQGDEWARSWVKAFESLGDKLRVEA